MNRCIYTKEQFESADGEHILQNFLGARWTSSKISSNQTQHRFGTTIDLALADGLKEIRNLLGARGGRGEPGPSLKNISGSAGTRFTVDPGGKPNIAEPVIKATQMPNGEHQVQVVMGDVKQLGWAVAKLREMFPETNFDIEELRQHVIAQSGYVNEHLNLRSGLGGDEFFRGMLKAAFNLLGASDVNTALLDVFDEVRTFILSGTTDCKKFVRWLNTAEEIVLPKIGDFDQFVCVYSKDSFVDGYIQFYGEIGFLLRLAEGYSGAEFCYGYLVDSLREATPAEIRNPDFSKDNIPPFESGNPLPNEAVWPIVSARFSRILQRYYRRADTQNLSRIVDDVLLPHVGQAGTPEMLRELSQKAAEYIAHRFITSWPK
ncbi:hypothetical protein B7L17_002070 [Burkholderia cenocepacia]|uniref:hypothetical protein n=1 Tax=Burkholderia cenocepacia TaxID=95486 RepID=UPI002237128B|nr:hypothetical protein [Burkholderia cenocepacia]MCW5115586.1 hypothetical protein [Burkholderia cenocepacia]MCW5129040.1 hypothetical protein [Burkholderia cenocepacia]MCW5172036.1 hypothetical protein [Burkholderia cenocepacia]